MKQLGKLSIANIAVSLRAEVQIDEIGVEAEGHVFVENGVAYDTLKFIWNRTQPLNKIQEFRIGIFCFPAR